MSKTSNQTNQQGTVASALDNVLSTLGLDRQKDFPGLTCAEILLDLSARFSKQNNNLAGLVTLMVARLINPAGV